jgi:type VI secretion system protein ImpE
MSLEAAELALRSGELDAALRILQEQIRKNPASAPLRIFLFQLLTVMGQWDRAMTQLNVAADLDSQGLAMAEMYREVIRCELLRAEVFSGRKSPVVFGEPEEWLALLIEALLVSGTARADQAQSLRQRAFASAPAASGFVNGESFDWIADADMRLGPVCEAVINGRYYWLPFSKCSRIDCEAPADLRDFVWMPARFLFCNGGEAVGVIPTRYPGSESSSDSGVRLARNTIWNEASEGIFYGLGQRILATDAAEYALMDVRTIQFGATSASLSQEVPHG